MHKLKIKVHESHTEDTYLNALESDRARYDFDYAKQCMLSIGSFIDDLQAISEWVNIPVMHSHHDNGMVYHFEVENFHPSSPCDIDITVHTNPTIGMEGTIYMNDSSNTKFKFKGLDMFKSQEFRQKVFDAVRNWKE